MMQQQLVAARTWLYGCPVAGLRQRGSALCVKPCMQQPAVAEHCFDRGMHHTASSCICVRACIYTLNPAHVLSAHQHVERLVHEALNTRGF